MKFATSVLAIAAVLSRAEAFTPRASQKCGRKMTTMLVDPNENKKITQKVISPNDISSLFGGSSSSSSSSKNKVASDYDDDEDEEYDYGEAESTSTTPPEKAAPLATKAKATAESAEEVAPVIIEEMVMKKPEKSEALTELLALEELFKRSPGTVLASEVSAVADDALPYVDEPEEEDEGMGYMNLNRKLDKATRKTVLDTLGLGVADSRTGRISSLTSGEQVAPRVFRYDPTETYRGDPMKYGAYRRWKLAETEDGKPRLDSQGRPMKTAPGSKTTGRGSKAASRYDA